MRRAAFRWALAVAPLAIVVGVSKPWTGKFPWPDAANRFARTDMSVPEIDYGTQTGSVQVASAERLQPVSGDGVSVLRTGLDALSDNDIAEARKARNDLSEGSLDRQILDWAIALSGSHAVPSEEITRMAAGLEGWPGMATLRRNSESALLREDPPPQTVIDTFGETQPETVDGVTALARAHVRAGNDRAAIAVLSPFWREERLSGRDDNAIIREFGALIPKSVHRERMEQMLHYDRITSAERVDALAGGEALTAAWGATIRNRKDADTLLEAVPESQRSAGFIYAQAKRLRRTGHFRQAAEVMMTAPADADALVDPDSWWVERRVLSRELLDIGEVELAYEIAAEHAAESPAMIADAEFHAGWYALRGLRDAKTAAAHFARIAEVADGPISLARAHYWLARAAEAGGPGDAQAQYERAAQYGTAYYGQLAAAKLDRTTIDAPAPEPTAAERRHFAGRMAVRAIDRLEQADHAWRAGVLYRDLAQELTSVGELALLAAKAEKQGNHYLALRVGKIAALRGMEIGSLAHPLGAIPASAEISDTGKALAYAIARQESEFNVAARSGAGALGLLQLLPGTAREMARRSGLDYSKNRLTSDAGYNATLGAAYLSEQLARFDGSYILTFIGYNAGPRRAREWIERYGDPRGESVEAVVDWVERIPYTETRNYVQRVMENYQVYKMRLTGQFAVVDDLVDGR